MSSDLASGTFFSVGTTNVTYSALDIHGNQIEKSFSVTVEDHELPEFSTIPELVEGTTSLGTCDGIVMWDAVTATDNCQVSSIVTSHESGGVFALGDTTVSALITDINGNQNSREFTVRITDTEAPQLLGMPENLILTTDPGDCGAIVTWNAPTPADNCQVNEFTGTHESGNFFDKGVTVVTYTVTDMSGNSYAEEFEVSVVDLEVPTIMGEPTDIVGIADPGSCTTSITWAEPTADDNCSVQTLISNYSPGDSFEVGTTTVAYTAQDPTGNITNVQFNVTVLDEEAPGFSSFPTPITVGNDFDQCSAIVTWEAPQTIDNCSVATIESNHQPGDIFSLGFTVVEYVVTDASGNSFTDSFTVTVEDTQAPQFQNSISSAVLDTDLGQCGAIHTWGVPEVLENLSLIHI